MIVPGVGEKKKKKHGDGGYNPLVYSLSAVYEN